MQVGLQGGAAVLQPADVRVRCRDALPQLVHVVRQKLALRDELQLDVVARELSMWTLAAHGKALFVETACYSFREALDLAAFLRS
jgi:hypothetical protein